MMMMMISL